MAQKISWLLQHKVIFIYFTGDLSIEAFVEMNQTVVNMLSEAREQGSQPIHIVSEIKNLTKLLSPLDVGKTITLGKEQGLGFVVISGIENPLIPFLTRIAGSVSGVAMRSFPYMEMALGFLMKHDTTLPDLTVLYRTQKDELTRISS